MAPEGFALAPGALDLHADAEDEAMVELAIALSLQEQGGGPGAAGLALQGVQDHLQALQDLQAAQEHEDDEDDEDDDDEEEEESGGGAGGLLPEENLVHHHDQEEEEDPVANNNEGGESDATASPPPSDDDDISTLATEGSNLRTLDSVCHFCGFFDSDSNEYYLSVTIVKFQSYSDLKNPFL